MTINQFPIQIIIIQFSGKFGLFPSPLCFGIKHTLISYDEEALNEYCTENETNEKYYENARNI